MATYSTSLKLTLIGDGEQTGTWGSTTNTNFGTLLEQAIVGQTTIIMTNADYTLTNLNGTTDEARSAVIIVTGTQNASYSVIVPAVPKLYMVTNSLTSPQVAYIKMTGGTTTQVPNGQTMYLYCTGVVGSSWGVLNYVQNAQNLITGGTITTGAINCTSLTSTGIVTGTTITGTLFSGPGTSITGTATSLNIGGNAATATTVSTTIASGATGTTQTAGTNNTTIATTAFVATAITNLSLGTMSTQNASAVAITGGTINGVTGTNAGMTVGTVSTTIASGAVGTTQTAGDNSTKIATTAYVATAVNNATSTLGTMATQNANAVAITGGTINGVTGTNAGMTVGNATAAVTATNLSGGTVNATTIGGTTITASSQFSGPGTGLTGTASSLNIGGNAATATSATTATTATTANALNTANAYQGTTFTATTQFNGPGTGLSGTAASLNIGGNAATATNATNATNSTNATTATNLSGGSVAATTITATGSITAAGRVFGTSPNSGSSGAVTLRDAVGNTDLVYLQATNNAATSQYGFLKFNSDGTILTSGNIIGNVTGNISGNALTATNTIGNGQTWQNVSGSRSISTNYNNSTGKPIQVKIYVSRSGGSVINMDAQLYTDAGLTDSQGVYIYDGGNWAISVSAIIPIGGNYSATWTNAGSVTWMELR